MATSNSSITISAATPLKRRGRLWPAWVIVGLGIAVIVYLRAFAGFDKGSTNAATGAAFVFFFMLLIVWTAFFAPFARAKRWSCIAGVVAFIVLLIGLVRVDGFTGDMEPIVHWRWSAKPAAALVAAGTDDIGLVAAGPIEWSPTPHDYPGFLGVNRDAYVPDVHLATDWKAQPPKLLWKHPIGEGYSGFAVVGNAAVTLEQRGEQELVSCYNLQTGKLQWFHATNARHSNPLGGTGPGSTPTLDDGRVYALGGTGILRCLDAATGNKIWIRDVLADVGTDYTTDNHGVWWGRHASPLIVDDMVVVPAGGPPGGPKVSLIAYNKQDGKIVWRGGDREVSYSSPSLATYGGVRQIVIVNEDTISGHDPKTGEKLWSAKWEGQSNQSASASQTVPVADDKFFVSKGYSIGGGALFEIKHIESANGEPGSWKVSELWHNHRVLETKIDNVVIKDGFVYGLNDGVMQCVDLKTGRAKWNGPEYGHGQLLRVGDVLLVTTEFGDVALVEFNPDEFHELAKFTALEGKTWNNPALAGNLLLVRNAQEAACYELPLAEKK